MPGIAACRAMGETGLLVSFDERIDPATSDAVLALADAVTDVRIAGVRELVPAYATLLVVFDPLTTTHDAIERAIVALSPGDGRDAASRIHDIPVRYDGRDLAAVAAAAGVTEAEVARLHAGADYRVYMYGFAPGYAYLGGVPEPLHLPRKPQAERGLPVGTVLIAGAQCLITTLEMPTGWWAIGTSPVRLLSEDGAPPLLRPGDRVRFVDER